MMINGFFKTCRVPTLGIFIIVIWLAPISHSQAEENGEQIFQTLCTACHTIGQGKLLGPDLADVTLRREEGWLKRQIKEPDQLIAENDPIAMQLLQEANNLPMVPLGLDDAQVDALIAYLKSTEQQQIVVTGFPSQYIPTVLVSLMLLIILTFVGLRAGKKNVDV